MNCPRQDNKQTPAVSIGMPIYNGERYVRRALDSLLAQTFTNFELLISDNASTDSTGTICREYVARDARVRIWRQPRNVGALENFRTVLELARGEYFMFAACDDSWSPLFLATLLGSLNENTGSAVAMSAIERFLEDGAKHDVIVFPPTEPGEGQKRVKLAAAIAWGKPYHILIYGLYRTRFMKKAFRNFPRVAAGDALFSSQVALATRVITIDEPLYRRLYNPLPLAVKYKGQELGELWAAPFAQTKKALTSVVFLIRSAVIPGYMKIFVPLLSSIFLIRALRWDASGLLRRTRL